MSHPHKGTFSSSLITKPASFANDALVSTYVPAMYQLHCQLICTSDVIWLLDFRAGIGLHSHAIKINEKRPSYQGLWNASPICCFACSSPRKSAVLSQQGPHLFVPVWQLKVIRPYGHPSCAICFSPSNDAASVRESMIDTADSQRGPGYLAFIHSRSIELYP